MRLVIEVDDPEIVVQLKSSNKTAPLTNTSSTMQSAEETEPRDAGAAPSAPGLGPLTNIAQSDTKQQSKDGNWLPGAGDPRPQVSAETKPESSSAQQTDEIPVFDAGTPSPDLLAGSVPTGLSTAN